MPHPLVSQLRFTRSEWLRSLDGLTDEESRLRLGPMNCISWNIGHLAWQEQRYWLYRMQGKLVLPILQDMFCYGCPGTTPPLDEMTQAWQTIITAVDPFLDTLTTADLMNQIEVSTPDGQSFTVTPGNMLQRVIYHYWYHIGENMAIRQTLGHTNLPDFVGNIDDEAPYTPHPANSTSGAS
jgi:uncharacterized damage-inducible protein DinB